MKKLYLTDRNNSVDELRGIAILLVVIGHVIQYVFSPEGFDNNFIFRIAYSFHMPLFMFIANKR